MYILLAWLAPGVLLSVALLIVGRDRQSDLSQWRRCAGHDPLDPSAKDCWVHVDSPSPYCSRHDGSGTEVVYV